MRTFLMTIVAFLGASLLLIGRWYDPREADDSSLEFLGKLRRDVKLRLPEDARGYTIRTGVMSVGDWLRWTPSLDALVPPSLETVQNAPIPGAETQTVTLEAYVVAVRFEHSDFFFERDNDLHVELSDSPEWNSDHIIVEVPPGPNYEVARKTAWDLVRQDAAAANDKVHSHKRILVHPVRVRVTGYVFLDAHHADKKSAEPYSLSNGKRGFTVDGVSRVKGLWEIHPVIAMTVIPG